MFRLRRSFRQLLPFNRTLPVGDTVTITGINFGNTQGSSRILFSPGITAAVVPPWGNTSIMVKVPSGAVTGTVSVSVNGTTSNGFRSSKHQRVADTTVSFANDVFPDFVASGVHRLPWRKSQSQLLTRRLMLGCATQDSRDHQMLSRAGCDSTGNGEGSVIVKRSVERQLDMASVCLRRAVLTTGLPDSTIV